MSKPFLPTDEQRRNVEALIGFGLKQADICLLILNPETGEPIDEKTLVLRFAREIATGVIKANTRVAESMYEMATKGDASSTKLGAAAFWLARRAGWKETVISEHTGKDGGPIAVDDVRERIAGRIAKIASASDEDVGFGQK